MPLFFGLLFVLPCVLVYFLFIRAMDRFEPEPAWRQDRRLLNGINRRDLLLGNPGNQTGGFEPALTQTFNRLVDQPTGTAPGHAASA